jgi:hypothetical protein
MIWYGLGSLLVIIEIDLEVVLVVQSVMNDDDFECWKLSFVILMFD